MQTTAAMIRFKSINKRKLSHGELGSLLDHWESSREGIIINTCKRLEYFSGEGEVPSKVAEHLFRLTSGLDSTIVGEGAIQGQVRKAYVENRLELSSALHQLFQRALYVGRRVRSETALSRGAVSYGQASAELVLNNLESELKDANITLTGAHAMNESIIRYLVSKGAQTIFIANRTFVKAQHLAEKHHCAAVSFEQLETVLSKTDVLISATAAPHLVIKKERFPKDKSMLILDLAMPIDVDPAIGTFAGVRLFSLAEIEQQLDQNKALRIGEITKAEAIVSEEVIRFITEQKRREKLTA